MRSRVFILSFLAVLLGTRLPVSAMDVLLGRIVSIDRQAGAMVLTPSGEDRRITVHFSPDNLPVFVREGSLVRVWGAFDSHGTDLFQASSIRNGSIGTGHDPTGVRGRIGNGWRRQGGGFSGRGGGGGRR